MNQNKDDQLELYLDGLMSEEESAAFLRDVDPQTLRAAVALNDQLAESLARIAKPIPLNETAIERAYTIAHASTANQPDANSTDANGRTHTNRRNAIQLALAATLLIAAGLGIWFGAVGKRIDPFFESRSLVAIYEETVQRGFRPVYNCEEEARFAATFQQNHGQSLALAQLPLGSRMLGLSTLGGISRSTTAMLCEVDNQKVIVYVDRAGNGDLAAALVNNVDSLNVFVEQKNGLVFCEVSPLDSARMIEHFEFLE